MLKNKKAITILVAIVLVAGAVFAYWTYTLNVAHSTFENYYAFRGCTELIERTDADALCKLADGSTIRLVQIDSRWYLEGDGPGVW